MDDFKILLSAAIDAQKAQNNINTQVNKLKTEAVKIGVELDTSNAKKVVKEFSEESKRLLNQNKTVFDNKLTTYLRQNTKLSTSLKNEIIAIQSQISNVDVKGLKDLQKQFNIVKSSAESLGKTGDTAFTKLGKNIKQFLSFMGAATVTMTAINTVRNMVGEVKNLDDQLLELSKVSDLSAEGLAKVTDEAFKLGETVGKTGTQVLSAITSFQSAGYEIEKSIDLAEQALIMTNIAEGIDNASISAKGLISIMKGYKDNSVEFAQKINDSINQVSNTQAIDFDNLVDGAQTLSAVANQAQVSFDQMLGILTGGYEILGDMSKVANGAITIFSRLQAIQLDGEDGVATIAKLQETFSNATKGVVNIVDETTGQLRGAYDILDDLSGIWDSLDKNTQSALATEAAGIRQKNTFLSIVSNWQAVEESVKSASNSMGSAEEENQKYLDSISGKISQFESQFQKMSSLTVDSDLVKSIVDFGTSTLKATNAVGGLVPVITTLGIAFGVHKLLIPILVKEMSALAVAEGLAESTTMSMIIKQHGLNGAFALGSVAVKSFISSMLPIVGVAAVVGGLIIAFDKFNVTLEEQQEITQAIKTEYDELESQLSEVNTELETTATRIDELNAKDNLSFLEQQELEKLKETTTQLESQNRLLKEQAEIKQRELADSIAQEFNKDMNTGGEYQFGTTTDSFAGAVVDAYVTEADYIKTILDEYQKLSNKDINLLTDEEVKQMEEYRSFLAESGTKYSDFANRYKIDDSTSQSWREMAELIDKTLNPTEYQQGQFDKIFNSESFATAKEELEELAKVRKLNPDVISSNETYKQLLSDTGMTAEQVAEHIKAITLETRNSASASEDAEQNILSLSEAIGAMSDSSQLISSLKEEIKELGYISTSSLQEIADKYPELESVVAKYNSGLASTEDVLNELSNVYETDFENYRNAVISKIGESDNFYNSFVNTLPQWVKNLAESYDLDFNNYKNLNEAKIALDKEYSTKKALLNKANSFQFDDYGAFGLGQLSNSVNSQFTAQLEKDIENINSIINGVDTSLDVSLNLKGYTPTKTKDANNKTDKSDPVMDAFNFGINGITGKNDLDHQIAMDKITLEEYYDGLEKINKATFGKHKKTHLENYRQYVEEVYKGQNQLAEQAIKDGFDKVNESISEYDDTLKEIDQYSSLVDEDSIESLALMQKGYEVASDKANALKKEIAELNTSYAKGEVPIDLYKDQLENLTSQFGDATSAMIQFENSIKDYYDTQKENLNDDYDNQVEQLESAHQDTLDALDDQLKKYQDIVDEKRKILQATEDEYQFQKKLKEDTDNVSKIQQELLEIDKAASTGDREAIARKRELEEELADAQSNLADTQHEREVDLKEKALDKELELYEDMIDDQKSIAETQLQRELQNAKTVYDEKIKNINELYTLEGELIKGAASLTIEEFQKAYDVLKEKASEVGMTPSTNFTDVMTGRNSSPITSILENANGKGVGSSKLNQYVMSKGYGVLSYQNMVDLANALGLSGFTVDKFKSEKEQEKLLKALKEAGFSTGGYIDASMIKRTGEDGIALVKHGEPILSVEQGKLFKELVNRLPQLNNLVKLVTPNVSNLITNNNSSPIFKFDNMIQINGDLNGDNAATKVKIAGNDVITRLTEIIRRN